MKKYSHFFYSYVVCSIQKRLKDTKDNLTFVVHIEILLGGIMFNKFFGGHDCGCDDMKTCGCGDCTWIIILILILCNCGCKIDPCLLIIILLLLCGCGCGNKNGGCC